MSKKEGWAFPANSRKAHYMVDWMALCRKYGFYFGPLEPAGKPSPDDCVQCARLLARRIAEIAAAHHVGASPLAGRWDVCDYCGHMWPCDTALVAARLAELEGLLRIALDTRGDADVYRKWEGILEHRVKGATGCVYHALKRECRLCELLACAARIENGDEQE